MKRQAGMSSTMILMIYLISCTMALSQLSTKQIRGLVGGRRIDLSRSTENCVVNITFTLTYPVKKKKVYSTKFTNISKKCKQIQSEYQKYKF